MLPRPDPRIHPRRFTISRRSPALSIRINLLGWRVDFHVKVSGILDPTSFWIGKADNRVLVVAMTPVEPGQAVWITGTVEGRNRDVYIRADSVTPE
jgi:hypothetical protein